MAAAVGNGCTRLEALGKDCIWAMDFVFDVTANGRSLKWLRPQMQPEPGASWAPHIVAPRLCRKHA